MSVKDEWADFLVWVITPTGVLLVMAGVLALTFLVALLLR